MKPFIALLCSCPLLFSSGVAWSINRDIENIQSSAQAQEKINLLRQERHHAVNKSNPILMSPGQIGGMEGHRPKPSPPQPQAPTLQHPSLRPQGSLPDTYEGLGKDRYHSPHGKKIGPHDKPKGDFGPVVVPAPFHPDKTHPIN